MDTTMLKPGEDVDVSALSRNMTFATPVMLLVPVAFAGAFVLGGTDLRWTAIAAGAAGWIVALALRAPVAVVAMKLLGSAERGKPLVVGSSGPLEEITRLLTLLIVGRAFGEAVSVGLGWASIEVVYTIATGFLTINLLRRTDAEALQAREVLAAQGMLRATGPALGVLERVGATALHIGFSLLVAWSALAVVVTAIAHSAVNLTLVRTFRSSALVSEIALLAIGFVALFAGVTLLA